MHSNRKLYRISQRSIALAAALASSALTASLFGQVRVVTLNATNTKNTNNGTISVGPRNGTQPGQRQWMTDILTAIGTHVGNDPFNTGATTGIAKPVDILCLQESDGWATTGTAYRDLLNNTIYPGANYQVAAIDGTYTDPQKSTQTILYNANALQLIGTAVVGTASGSGQPRQAVRVQLRPIGYTSASDLYIYNSHYKSSDDATSRTRRDVEAQAIRTNADALGANKNIIYLGGRKCCNCFL